MLYDPRFQLRQRIDQGELRGVALDLALGDAGGVTRCDRAYGTWPGRRWSDLAAACERRAVVKRSRFICEPCI
jgi:hypothetical protein